MPNGIKSDYRLDARVILDNFNPSIVNYFNNNIKGSAIETTLYDAMSPWYVSKGIMTTEITLFDIVCYLIEDTMLKYDTIKAALDYFYNNKRSRKNYFYRVVTEEYEGRAKAGNPYYLKKYADAYMLLSNDNRQNLEKMDASTCIDNKYGLVKAWRYNKESFLYEFDFFASLDIKRQTDNILVDIGYEIFNVLSIDFHGDFGKYSVSFPSELIQGQFGPLRQQMDLEISLDENGNPISSASSVVKQEDGSEIIIKTIADRMDMDYSSLSNDEVSTVLDELRMNNALLTQAEKLSYREQNTLTYIYSYFDLNVVNQEKMVFQGLDFCRRCTGNSVLRSKDVREVLKSLEKLACSELRVSTMKDGEVVGVSLVSFFDLRYAKADGAGDENIISLHSGNVSSDGSSIPDEILMSPDWNIEIFPSYFLKESWQEKVNSVLYSRQYDKIADNKTRAYMMLLQDERLRSPEDTFHFFGYGFFRNKMQLTGRFVRVKKEILNQLDSLIANHVIVDHYEAGDNGVTIYFLPFTELEQELYFEKSKHQRLG